MNKVIQGKPGLSARVRGGKVESEDAFRPVRFLDAIVRAEKRELRTRTLSTTGIATECEAGGTCDVSRVENLDDLRSLPGKRRTSASTNEITDDIFPKFEKRDQLEGDSPRTESTVLVWPGETLIVSPEQVDTVRSVDRVGELTRLANRINRSLCDPARAVGTELNGSVRAQTLHPDDRWSLELIESRLGIEMLQLSMSTQGFWSLRLGVKRGFAELGSEELDDLKADLARRGHLIDHVVCAVS